MTGPVFSEVDIPLEPDETTYEYIRRVGETAGLTEAEIERLIDDVERVSYSPQAHLSEDGQELVARIRDPTEEEKTDSDTQEQTVDVTDPQATDQPDTHSKNVETVTSQNRESLWNQETHIEASGSRTTDNSGHQEENIKTTESQTIDEPDRRNQEIEEIESLSIIESQVSQPEYEALDSTESNSIDNSTAPPSEPSRVIRLKQNAEMPSLTSVYQNGDTRASPRETNTETQRSDGKLYLLVTRLISRLEE